jgi:hypothetical protein
MPPANSVFAQRPDNPAQLRFGVNGGVRVVIELYGGLSGFNPQA